MNPNITDSPIYISNETRDDKIVIKGKNLKLRWIGEAILIEPEARWERTDRLREERRIEEKNRNKRLRNYNKKMNCEGRRNER